MLLNNAQRAIDGLVRLRVEPLPFFERGTPWVQLTSGLYPLAVQVTAASEEQGASTQEMAAAAGALLQAAEKLRGLVRGFRV